MAGPKTPGFCLWNNKIQQAQTASHLTPAFPLLHTRQPQSASLCPLTWSSTTWPKRKVGVDANVPVKSRRTECRQKPLFLVLTTLVIQGEVQRRVFWRSARARSNVRESTLKASDAAEWKRILTDGCPSTTNIAGPSYPGPGSTLQL